MNIQKSSTIELLVQAYEKNEEAKQLLNESNTLLSAILQQTVEENRHHPNELHRLYRLSPAFKKIIRNELSMNDPKVKNWYLYHYGKVPNKLFEVYVQEHPDEGFAAIVDFFKRPAEPLAFLSLELNVRGSLEPKQFAEVLDLFLNRCWRDKELRSTLPRILVWTYGVDKEKTIAFLREQKAEIRYHETERMQQFEVLEETFWENVGRTAKEQLSLSYA